MKANFQAKAFFDFTASTRLFGRLKFYLRFVLDNWCIFICFAYTRGAQQIVYIALALLDTTFYSV